MENENKRRQSWNDLSIFEKFEVMHKLSYYPALSLVCIFRRNVGYRVLNPGPLAAVATIMFFLGGLAVHSPNSELIQFHAFVMLVAGLVQRRKRKREMKAGARIHSWYFGDSGFEFAWVPDSMKRDRQLPRGAEPALAFVAGLCVADFSPVWGMWLMLAALGLGASEAALLKRMKDREMDTLDAMIESEHQAELVEELTRRHSSARIYSNDKADVIHAKLSEDVEALIARRKKPRGK